MSGLGKYQVWFEGCTSKSYVIACADTGPGPPARPRRHSAVGRIRADMRLILSVDIVRRHGPDDVRAKGLCSPDRPAESMASRVRKCRANEIRKAGRGQPSPTRLAWPASL